MRTRTHLALGAVLALGVGLAACGDDDEADDTETTVAATEDAATATTEASTDVTEGDEGATAETSAATEPDEEPSDTDGDAATVNLASDDEFGDYLVDEDGLTLYVFTRDEGTTSACTSDQCMDAWPPVAADDPTAGEGVDAGALGTAEALAPNQVTYHDQLLYYFVGDQAPGDINGVEIEDWYPVGPSGAAIGLDDGDGDEGESSVVDDGGDGDEGGY